MAIAITKLRKYYMDKINKDDVSTYESVERYIDLVKLYRKMQSKINEDGPSTKIENGQQSYIKSHPLITDMKNINAQLINLKKDIDRHVSDYERILKAQAQSKEVSDDDIL